MSILEPQELRYAAISAFGLMIFTTLLKWTGVGSTRYSPVKPSTGNVTDAGQRSTIDQIMNPSLTESALDPVIDMVLTPLQLVIDQLIMWGNVYDAMGLGSIFIIVPMLIMVVIVVGAIIKIVEAVLP
jgi:hypothetical protein